MAKLRQLSPDLWPLIDVILFSYIELIFRGGVSCLPAALLFIVVVIPGHNLGNSQVSVNRTIGPTLVKMVHVLAAPRLALR